DAVDHDVVGEAPYLAERLQAASKPGSVAICSGTRQLLGSLFEYEDLESLRLDGIAKPVAASIVLRESAIRSRFEALRPRRRQLIGRDEEVALLLRRWNQAKSGDGRVVLIWGEPGIGKSRLVAAFQDAIEREPHTRLRYFCAPN